MFLYDKIIHMNIKNILDPLLFFLKILFCLFWSSVLVYEFMNVMIRPCLGSDNWDWQIIFYLFLTAITMIVLWLVSFKKLHWITRALFVIILIFQFQSLHLLPSAMEQLKYISCVEDGLCDEGLEVTAKDGKRVIINKENCIKNGWEWIEDGKTCNIWNKNNN